MRWPCVLVCRVIMVKCGVWLSAVMATLWYVSDVVM